MSRFLVFAVVSFLSTASFAMTYTCQTTSNVVEAFTLTDTAATVSVSSVGGFVETYNYKNLMYGNSVITNGVNFNLQVTGVNGNKFNGKASIQTKLYGLLHF